ncbi:CLUMA_CG000019, isoform A [Clunio marinus]|uniref:Tetraspanin n=1 Tax=Clunio marinus TaxID=568069 RepID=A0A1J1HI66_9DIPT|nr:CLUMA_CG000019, isoform A [Clunio marinus]
MAKDIGSNFAKYTLCFFNFFFFLFGSITLALGLWMLFDKKSLVTLLRSVDEENVTRFTEPQLIEQSVYIFIGIGGLMFVLGFLGYCGAMRESQCLLSLYGVLIIVLLVLEIIIFSLALLYKEVARDEIQNFLTNTIPEYKSSAKENDAVTLMWNQLMAQMGCCGVNSYNDFDKSQYWMTNKVSRVVPEACCILSDKVLIKPQDLNCPYEPSESNSFYMKGCFDEILAYSETNKYLIIGVCGGLILTKLIAAFLAFCIC